MGAHGHRRHRLGPARAGLLPQRRIGHRGAHAAALGALVALTALPAAGCSGDAGPDAALPEFAARLPGRTAVVVWGETPPPAEMRQLLDRMAEAAGLLAVTSGDDAVVAYRSPDDLEIGWVTLADSTTFAAAMERGAPGGGHVVYLDLQQLVEMALRRDVGPRAVRERLARGLALRGLQSAVLALTREGGRWAGQGVIGTSGVEAGLPGLLTTPVEGRARKPAIEPDAVFQLEAFYDPSIAEHALAEVTAIEDRSFFSGALAGPARKLDGIAAQLDGRVGVTFYENGDFRAAARVRNHVGLSRALHELYLPGLPRTEISVSRDWAVLTSPGLGFRARGKRGTEGTAPVAESGPFVWLHLRVEGMRVSVHARRRARDAIAVELELER